MIDRIGLKENEAELIMNELFKRVKLIPYAEDSEEVRIQIVDLLAKLLKLNKFEMLKVMSDLSISLSSLLMDTNPEMKVLAADLACDLSQALKDKCGGYMKGVVSSLVKNVGHQPAKVRKASLLSLKQVIIAKNAEPFLEDALAQLKLTANDRSPDVKKTLYDMVEFWFTNLETASLITFEKDLLLLMINGVADEKEETSQSCIAVIETHGKNMREYLESNK